MICSVEWGVSATFGPEYFGHFAAMSKKTTSTMSVNCDFIFLLKITPNGTGTSLTVWVQGSLLDWVYLVKWNLLGTIKCSRVPSSNFLPWFAIINLDLPGEYHVLGGHTPLYLLFRFMDSYSRVWILCKSHSRKGGGMNVSCSWNNYDCTREWVFNWFNVWFFELLIQIRQNNRVVGQVPNGASQTKQI